MAKTELPAIFFQSGPFGAHGSMAGERKPWAGERKPWPGDDVASPEEGAELIRAFLQIERRDTRTAIIELVTHLSGVSPRS